FAEDTRAFVAGAGVVLLDLGNPPFNRGSIYTNQVSGVAAQGNYAVVTEESGLKVIDVSDPASPAVVGAYRGSGFRDLALAGNYGVLAQGRQGLTLLDFGPALAAGPKIDRDPDARRTLLQGSARFEVVAHGTIPLSYQWQFNGADLAGATDASLVLTNVQLSQAGHYSVLIRNSVGVALSSNATLTMDLPPSVALTAPL